MPGRSYALPQAAKTTLFAAGNKANVRKKRRRRLFSNELVEEIAVPIDVRRQVQRMLARQALRKLRVTALQRFNDLQMVDDGARRTIALRDGRASDRTDMQ
jgi:hypothetical protein